MKWNKMVLPIITKYPTVIRRIYQVPKQLQSNHLSTFNCLKYCWDKNAYGVQKPKSLEQVILAAQYKFPTQVNHTFVRGYAKGKDKKKSDKGKKKVEINEAQLSEVINVDALKSQMQKTVDNLKEEYVKNLSLRSTTGSIETLQVNLDGKEYTLQELAQVVRKNPKTLVINMSVFPQAISAVLAAIQKSGMNLNPQQDGTAIYVPVPKVTKEHRENLAKNAKMLFIKCRDSIKDIQNKYLKNVKNNSTISEDLSHDVQYQIVSLGEQYVLAADKVLEAKQTELIGKE